MSDQNNSQEMLVRYRAGDSTAARDIFDRYVQRLVQLVRARLSPQLARRLDPDDVVQSAYRSFFLHARNGEFELKHSGDLWRLLATIALHKLRHQVDRHMAGRRDVRQEAGSPQSEVMPAIAASEPSPDEVAALIDEWKRALLNATPQERIVMQLRLAGESIETIAGELGRSPRTVRRILETLRLRFNSWLPGAAAPRAPRSNQADPRAPLAFADYTLQEHLGTGGMGKVYRALERGSQQPVAIKALLKAHQYDAAAIERFLREGELLAKLRHPNIVGVRGLGRFPGGGYFLVLDLIDGQDLAARMALHSFALADIYRIMQAVAQAIDHAHAGGIIHCDLKPANVLLNDLGGVFVTDFGLAQLRLVHGADAAIDTRAGGTLEYMAPEQFEPVSSAIGPATDVYGLGGLLYSLLTGKPPLQVNRIEAARTWHAENRMPMAPSQLRPNIPAQLDEICFRCLSKSPASRYPSAAKFAAALGQAAVKHPPI